MNGVILYSQRVEIVESYGERRDCADQNIPRFLQECGFIPVPISNVIQNTEQYLAALHPQGIVLTGGNSLITYGGNAPERDQTDSSLIKYALEQDIPIYGFCRGMQSLMDYFKVPLTDVSGHVAVRHEVSGLWGTFEVNSYHNQAALDVSSPLIAAMRSKDGVIEAITSNQYKIMGTMWHPERETPFREIDVERTKEFFGKSM